MESFKSSDQTWSGPVEDINLFYFWLSAKKLLNRSDAVPDVTDLSILENSQPIVITVPPPDGAHQDYLPVLSVSDLSIYIFSFFSVILLFIKIAIC